MLRPGPAGVREAMRVVRMFHVSREHHRGGRSEHKSRVGVAEQDDRPRVEELRCHLHMPEKVELERLPHPGWVELADGAFGPRIRLGCKGEESRNREITVW